MTPALRPPVQPELPSLMPTQDFLPGAPLQLSPLVPPQAHPGPWGAPGFREPHTREVTEPRALKAFMKFFPSCFPVTFERSFCCPRTCINLFLLVNQHLKEKPKVYLFFKSSMLNTSSRTKLIHKHAKGLQVVEMKLCLWSFLSPSINTRRRSSPILMFTE